MQRSSNAKAEDRQHGGKRKGNYPLVRVIMRVVKKIAAASVAQIEAWFDQAIDATRLDDVFGSSLH